MDEKAFPRTEFNEDQNLLKAVFNSSLDRVHVFKAIRDEKNEIVDYEWAFMNNAAITFWGNCVGKRWLHVYPGAITDGFFDVFKEVTETGKPQQLEKYYGRDGIDTWVHQSIVKIGDGIANTTRDITAQKKAEQEIKDQALYLNAITENNPDLISVIDLDTMEMEFVNMKTLISLGFSSETDNFIKKPKEERRNTVHPDDQEALSNYFNAFRNMTDSDIETLEYRATNNRGESLTFLARGRVFRRNEKGFPTHCVNIIHNISDQKEAEREILRLKDEIAQRATDRYHSLFNSVDEGFCIIELLFDQDGTIIDLIFREQNPSFDRHTGLGNVVGKKISELLPNFEKHWIEVYTEVARTGDTIRSENYVQDVDRWYSTHHLKVGDDSSPFVAVVFDDITERKKAEQRQVFLLRLNDTIRTLRDPLKIQAASADLLGEHLKANQVHYGETIGEYIHISHSYTDGLPPMIGQFYHPDFGDRLQNGYRAGLAQVCCHAESDTSISEIERTNLTSANIGAFIAMPLVKDGQWVATLGIHSIKPRNWEQSEIDLVQEVAERTWAAVERAKAEEALRKSQELLKTELEDSKKLQQISNRIIEGNNIQDLYDAILDSVSDIMQAEMASLQIFLPEKDELLLLAYKGLHPDAAKGWEHLDIGSTTSCARALKKGERVIYSDINDPDLEIDENILTGYRMCGIASMQSTPLISRTGKVLGILSSHWKQAYDPSTSKLNLIDVLARQTADLIEQKRAERTLRINETRMRRQKEAFQSAIDGVPLQESLNILAHMVIEETKGQARTAFYIANDDGTCLHPVRGTGNMAEGYLDEVDGFAIGLDSLACGLAVPTGESILSADVHEEPLWEPWVYLADKYAFRGCWSFPIKTKEMTAVGTFAMYFETHREASPRDLALADIVTQSAAVIITNYSEARERDRAEKALRESEELMASIFKISPIGIGFADTEGKFILLNDEMRRFLPNALMPSKDDKNYSRWIAFDANGTRITRQNYPSIRALAGNPIIPYLEMQYINDDGSKTWTRVASTPMQNQKGEIVGTVSVITDIDELKQTTEALRESERQLKQLVKEKDDFIGIASHELKTPVTNIKAYAEIVQERLEKISDSKNSGLLSKLNTQIDRLTTLINHLLDTTNISENGLKLAFEKLQIYELLEERMEEVKRTTDHVFELKMDELPLVNADRERIGQVITNLLSNAAKYSPKGSTITVSGTHSHDSIHVSVRDSGYGIPEEDQPRLFERFFRVTSNNMDTFPGMGLGLYISAQIIEKHGGTISVQSKPGEGSTFTFTIPYSNS